MRRDTPPKSANPGGERGMNRSDYKASAVPGTRRPQTARQAAVAPGRVAHSRTGAAAQSRGRSQGVGIGATLVGSAMAIKGAYDKNMAENAKYDAFNRGKVAGRQTTSTGAKAEKSTYEAPMTKALKADGAKPVMKPK